MTASIPLKGKWCYW